MVLLARDIEAAAKVLANRVVRTPLVASPRLSELLGAEVFLKLENLHFTGSFKDRGSCNRIHHLREQDPHLKGVIAASAGNHAQGVAFHAGRFGIPATIVMPQTTPFAKVERTEALGASVVLHGESLLEAGEKAQELVAERGLTFLHPYDDEHIIAGQGTCALEMLEDQPDLDVLVIPIGGGGLCAGMAIYAREKKPHIRIVGVQTTLCPSMHHAVKGLTPNLRTDTIADGIAVKRPGKLTQPYIQCMVNEITLVEERSIEKAVVTLANTCKTVAEGGGAVGLAAMMDDPKPYEGKKVGIVISGGNIDSRLLSNILIRGLRRDGKIARIRIEISDRPGVLAQVTSLVGATGADIIEIEHQRLFSVLPPRRAELDVVMETRGKAHVETILAALQQAGYTASAT